MKQETLFFRLEVLSPLHIGCDEDYEPTNFVIDEKNGELINFNPLEFISNLKPDDREEFSKICNLGTIASLLDIYKFMQRHANQAKGRRIRIGTGFQRHYADTLRLSGRDQRRVRKELNQFRIERTAFQPLTGISYIPGSAIKGAIRTALLNLRKPKYPVPVNKGDKKAGQKLERTIFNDGSFATDPMRLVKVSDFIAEKEPANRIVYAVDKKKKPSEYESSAPYQILEIVQPGATFVGSVTIVSPENECGELPHKPVTTGELKDAVSRFFRHEKERENRQLAAVGIAAGKIPADDEKLLLRAGRHSGAESLTIDGYRHIKIMQGRGKSPKYLNRATTFWLASEQKKPSSLAGLQPFGWLSATALTPEEVENIKATTRKERETQKQKLADMAQQRRADEKKRLAQEQIRLAEEKRADEEKATRVKLAEAQKENWENLAPEEQNLMIVRGDDLAREFALEKVNDPYSTIWSDIDSTAPEQQKALARAFKERWQKEGNWKVKKAKKKQFAKVQKVKAILGEN